MPYQISWAAYYASRARLTETNNINLGLLSLKRCVAALLENERRAPSSRARPARIPFLDSKLTALMREPLQSKSLCCVICAGCEDDNAAETIGTLRFGEACRQLSSAKDDEPTQDGDALASALAEIDASVARLQLLIASKERWEWRDQERVSQVTAHDGPSTVLVQEQMELGGVGAVQFVEDDGSATKIRLAHSVRGQVIVGAEAENAELERLLQNRRALLGD